MQGDEPESYSDLAVFYHTGCIFNLHPTNTLYIQILPTGVRSNLKILFFCNTRNNSNNITWLIHMFYLANKSTNSTKLYIPGEQNYIKKHCINLAVYQILLKLYFHG